MTLFLTPDELRDLTDLEQPAAQVRWLRDHGWVHEVGASGRPKVSRAYYDAKMAGRATEAPESAAARTRPDLEALDAIQTRH